MDLQRIIYLVKETKRNHHKPGNGSPCKRKKGVADYVTQVDVAVQNFLKKKNYINYTQKSISRRRNRLATDEHR